MPRMKPERLKELEKYTKADIIGAIGRNFSAGYIVEDLLRDLETTTTTRLFAKEKELNRIQGQKMKQLLNWRAEMCRKYGDGSTVKLLNIPPEEIKRGAKFEQEYDEATKAVANLEKRINKAMEISNENNERNN